MTTNPPDGRRDFAHSNNPGFESAASVILLPFGRESYLRAAVDAYHAVPVELDETTDRLVYQLPDLVQPITLVYSGMGGPAVANALEMVKANGARQVVLIGACGGVDPQIGIGDLLVASAAVRGEGTSRYYAALEFPAACDTEITHRLWKAASNAPIDAHCGLVFTTDASYRQGSEVYETFNGMLLGVECECATAAVVARRLGLRLGTLLFCTDNVMSAEPAGRRYRGLAEPRVRSGFDNALRIVVDVLSQFSRTA